MTPATLRSIGEALFGAVWQAPMSRLIAKSKRMVRWYLDGRPIPVAVQRTLLATMYERAYKLTELAREIKLPEPETKKGAK